MEEKDEKLLKTNYLHVLGVSTNAVYQLSCLNLTGADSVNGGEEWELVFHALRLQHMIHFFSGNWALKTSVLVVNTILN